jgi:hypothetical protein
MNRKIVVGIFSCAFLFAQACASHNRQQHCHEQLMIIQAAIAAESTEQSGPNIAATTIIHMKTLEARLKMEVVVGDYEEKHSGKKWCRIDFWQNGNHIALWAPGCSKYEWSGNDLVLYYSLGEGTSYIQIYEHGHACLSVLGN